MENCNHIAYQKQFELEHFVLVVARCQRCEEFLQAKAFPKEDSKQKEEQKREELK